MTIRYLDPSGSMEVEDNRTGTSTRLTNSSLRPERKPQSGHLHSSLILLAKLNPLNSPRAMSIPMLVKGNLP